MPRLLTLFLPMLSILLFAGCPQVDGVKKETQKADSSDEKTAVDGTKDAEKDIKDGLLKVWTMPLPSPPWAGKHFQLCKENGITLKSTKSVEEFKTEYISAYNKRMNAEIAKKFGPGFIQKLEQQAQK